MSSLEVAVLDAAVLSLIERIEKHAGALSARIPDFERRILSPLRALTHIQFQKTNSNAAFEWKPDEAKMLMNADHIATIMHQIEHAKVSFGGAGASAADAIHLQGMGLDMFVIHEIDHIGQGIPNHADVQALKLTEGPLFMAKLDLQADLDAATVWAWLNSLEHGNGSHEAFAAFFAEALYFLCKICVPAFGVSIESPAKVARALGLFLTLIRAYEGDALSIRDEMRVDTGLPLTAPLMLAFSPEWRVATLSTSVPTLRVLTPNCAVPQEWAPAFAIYIATGDFKNALDIAMQFARRLLS